MPAGSVDYNSVAPTYDGRYAVNPLRGVAAALRGLAAGAGRVLEVGCGTGRWLAELAPLVGQVAGLDLSPGMLAEARRRPESPAVVCGPAERLPLAGASFDLVYCVHALQHFSRPQGFIAEARRLLRPGGTLAIVGTDPHQARQRWYLYDYFEGTLATDLRRFPSTGTLVDWLVAAGFARVEWRPVEHVFDQPAGRAVLDDFFLRKASTSQLTLLSDEAYAAGLARIEAALTQAEAQGQTLLFPTDLTFDIVIGTMDN